MTTKHVKYFAVLRAPEFRLQAALRHAALLPGMPLALVDTHGRKALVAECNAAARAAGICIGLAITQAMARCSQLQLLSGSPGQERSAQDILLQTAEAFSPHLESTAPGVVTVELPVERNLEEQDFIGKGVHPLHVAGLETRIGVASTPDLAMIAARFAEPLCIVDVIETFLAPLPIAALVLDDPEATTTELLSVLDSWGIHTVGQLLALPREATLQRLGPEAVQLWNLAFGGQVRPLKMVRPREFYMEQADLEHPVETLEPLLFILRRFVEKISARLAAVYLVAGKIRLILRFENGSPYQHVFTIPEPTRDVELLLRMLCTHLEGFTSDSPVMGVELAARPTHPMEKQFSLLDRSVRNPHQMAETLARLEALLGPGRVGTPELTASTHPDAFRLLQQRDAAPSSGDAGTVPFRDCPGACGEAPLMGIPYLRFRPPVAARVLVEENRPSYVQSAPVDGPIREARGPWMLEGNWWNREHWAREEWDAATDAGIYRLIRIKEGWFLDGVYSFVLACFVTRLM